MYIPRHNRVEDKTLLHQLMQDFNFAILVTTENSIPVATHLPFMLDPQRGEYGTLIAHLARANHQWKAFGEQEVLVIFQGYHGYISPSWYSEHPSVPTWNYMIVHAYGVPRIVEDETHIEAILRELVDHHESSFEHPWGMDLPADYQHKMIQAILPFEIEITRLEGKFKLSQNRSSQDQAQVIEALGASPRPDDHALAGEMQKYLKVHEVNRP